MLITEIMTNSDMFTDETVSQNMAIAFVNEAISIVNSKLGVHLPFFDSSSSYTALNSSWQYRLFITYVSYGVKMNDTSLTEAQEYKSKFYDALGDLELRILSDIPEDYWGSEVGDGNEEYDTTGVGGAYDMDTSYAINVGWWDNTDRGEN